MVDSTSHSSVFSSCILCAAFCESSIECDGFVFNENGRGLCETGRLSQCLDLSKSGGINTVHLRADFNAKQGKSQSNWMSLYNDN